MSVGLHKKKDGQSLWLQDYCIEEDGHRAVFTDNPALAKRWGSAESAKDWKERDDMLKGLGTPKKLP